MASEVIRRTAPTRPHPVVARRPPGNVLSALPLSVIDRTRDALDRLERSGSPRVVSSARAVERLPLFQRGEDPRARAGRTELEA